MAASHSQVENIVADLNSALARVHHLQRELPEDQWEKRNDPTRWSVAECIQHLNLTSRAYVPVLAAALKAAPPLESPRTFRRDPVGVLLGLMTAPIRTIGKFQLGRMPTSREFVPKGALIRDQVVRDFENDQRTLLELTDAARRYEIDRVKIVSPFDARVKYNVYSALRIVAGHQHRHLAQAESVWGDGVRPASS